MQVHKVGSPIRVAIDITGPLPETHQGNRYILVIGDYCTKWTEAFPIPDQETTTVAKVLVEEVFCRLGCAHELHSDQGRNFESNIFQETCKLLDIIKTRTTPLHPMSDGMIERFNRTLKSKLSLFVEERQRDWDEHLPYLMMAYRSATHESTGFSPNEMMLGRTVHLPVDLMCERPPNEDDENETPAKYVCELIDKTATVHRFARQHLKQSSLQQKNNYDRKIAGKQLQVGDAVWLHNPSRKVGRSPKLQRPWDGPYLILDQLNQVTYRIQKSRRAKPKVIHYNRLKPYKGNNPPIMATRKHRLNRSTRDTGRID